MSHKSGYTLATVLLYIRNEELFRQKAYYSANMEGIDAIIDVDNLLSKIDFTNRQLAVLESYFRRGNTQNETALLLGLTRSQVQRDVQLIKAYIRGELLAWNES